MTEVLEPQLKINLDLTDVRDRIIHLMQHFRLNGNSFSKIIGTDSTVLYSITVNNRKGSRNKPSFDLLVKICQSLPNVCLEWLILGTGEMIKTPNETKEIKETKESNHISTDYEQIKTELDLYRRREYIYLEQITNLVKR